MIGTFSFVLSPPDPSVSVFVTPSVASCVLQNVLGDEWASRRPHITRPLLCPIGLSLIEPDHTRLSLTVLGNHWIETLLRHLESFPGASRLIIRRQTPETWGLAPVGIPRFISFSELLCPETSAPTLTLRFLRPVVLTPFPDPHDIFEWLFRKWNHHSPKSARLPRPREDDLRKILVSRHRLSRSRIRSGSRPEFGFTGRVSYDLKDFPPEHRPHLFAVARFAAVFGLGWGTHLGFGRISLQETPDA